MFCVIMQVSILNVIQPILTCQCLQATLQACGKRHFKNCSVSVRLRHCLSAAVPLKHLGSLNNAQHILKLIWACICETNKRSVRVPVSKEKVIFNALIDDRFFARLSKKNKISRIKWNFFKKLPNCPCQSNQYITYLLIITMMHF